MSPALRNITREQFEEDPLGVVILSPRGEVRQYNFAQAKSGDADQPDFIGKNFFREVMSCAAVPEFEGRFMEFGRRQDTALEAFDFTFSFPWGTQKLKIAFVRKENREDVCIVISSPAPVPEAAAR